MSVNKINLALQQGRLKGAKALVSNMLNSEHGAEWAEVMRAEYEELYPSHRHMNTDEIIEHDEQFTEDNPKPEDYEYPMVEIVYIKYDEGEAEYRTPEDYQTYSEWLAETRIVSEAVYYTYAEYLETVSEGMEAVPEDEWIPTIKEQEVTEQVRPYVPLTLTDEMIEERLSTFDAYAQYKSKLKDEAKAKVVVEHNAVKYQGDPMSINFMSAVGAIGAMRMFQVLVQSGVISQEQYDAVYKTTEAWKGADNTVHNVHIESIVEALELAMLAQAKAIGVKP